MSNKSINNEDEKKVPRLLQPVTYILIKSLYSHLPLSMGMRSKQLQLVITLRYASLQLCCKDVIKLIFPNSFSIF